MTKLPLNQLMLRLGVAVVGASVLTQSLMKAGGETPKTINAEWRAANKELMRFQNMNPIGLGGRPAYDPPYLKKEAAEEK